jgi:hypothetical protein
MHPLLNEAKFYHDTYARYSTTADGAKTIFHLPYQLSLRLMEVKNSFEEGRVLLINKPLHWTSFDA